MIGHREGKVAGDVLAAAIGVMDDFAVRVASSQRHHQGVDDDVGGGPLRHRPAGQTSIVEVEDAGQVELAVAAGELGDVGDLPVASVMSDQPVYVFDSDVCATALGVMAVSGYRHVPVVDTNRKVVGIVSPQRVTGFLKQHL